MTDPLLLCKLAEEHPAILEARCNQLGRNTVINDQEAAGFTHCSVELFGIISPKM